MEYSNVKKVIIWGIGGKGAYYIAKFLNLLNVDISGYDLKESQNTKELEELGIKINYRNPEEEKFNCDFFIYTNDIPLALQKKVIRSNRHVKRYEVGEFYHLLVSDFEKGIMNEKEKNAFLDSDIAPLFKIDCSKMKYISITGTDGKTTSCTMIYHILRENGFKPALITTVSAKIGNEDIDTGFHTTTPSSQELYSLIKKAENERCTHLIIEATSHGLHQGRLSGLKFDIVGYTNITKEHLDYHKTWRNYVDAKSLLIREHLKENGKIVLNRDDKAYGILKKYTKKHIDYSIKRKSYIYAENICSVDNGIKFDLIKPGIKKEVTLPILGIYNVSNFLLASSILLELGIDLDSIVRDIKSFSTVSGRMQILQKRPFTVIVDYAHTPNAEKEVLISARKMIDKDKKIIHIFGSAGQRDPYKRPEMGRISNELADITILTAEDCRLEKLSDINDQIEKGWKKGKNKMNQLIRFDNTDKNVEVRRDAIKKGLEMAKEGDLLIITGKAHERSLCFGQTEYSWNDIEETEGLLSNS